MKADETYRGNEDATKGEAAPCARPGEKGGRNHGPLSCVNWLQDFLKKHEEALWWIHSAWALIFGIGVMWLGAKNSSVLRFAFLYIAFIWISTLFLPALTSLPHLAVKWQERLKVVSNYFNKNFYQQLLFFVIPIYFASSTFWSWNSIFMILLVASAILSTLDIVYDRHIAEKWYLMTLFMGFNIFVCMNAILAVLWSVSPHWSALVGILLSSIAFATMVYRFTPLRRRPFWVMVGGAAVFMVFIVTLGRPLIPPVPLSLAPSQFGQGIDRSNRQISDPMISLPYGYEGKIYALTPIKAPFGLSEKVRHRWFVNGRLAMTTSPYQVTGGRKEGFRYWTYYTVKPGTSAQTIRVDVETESGQLIGRAILAKAD